MARTAREVNQKKIHSYYDYSLLFLTIFLVGFGLVMIYSTSSYNAQRDYGRGTYYLERQALFAGAGIFFMILVSKIDYRLLIEKLPVIKIRPVTLLYILCFFLQIYVLIFGEVINGAKRWIKIGELGSFQPSELSKVAVILFTAYIINLAPKRLDKVWGFFRVLLFISPLIVLVVIENFSTALVMGIIMVSMCFVASRKKGYFIGFAILLLRRCIINPSRAL